MQSNTKLCHSWYGAWHPPAQANITDVQIHHFTHFDLCVRLRGISALTYIPAAGQDILLHRHIYVRGSALGSHVNLIGLCGCYFGPSDNLGNAELTSVIYL